MQKKHNYPRSRAPRNTSYSKKHKLIEKHSVEKIKKTWKARGMYKTADKLGCSPYVIRDIAQTKNWKRPAEKVPHLVAAVRSGKKDPSNYKTLDFSNVNLNSKEDDNEE